jgi:hypothetical protein
LLLLLQVVQVEALLPAAAGAAEGSSADNVSVAQAWLVLQRYPRGLFPLSDIFAVHITSNSITKMTAAESADQMRELEQQLPELAVQVGTKMELSLHYRTLRPCQETLLSKCVDL